MSRLHTPSRFLCTQKLLIFNISNLPKPAPVLSSPIWGMATSASVFRNKASFGLRGLHRYNCNQMLQLLILFQASLTEFSIFAIASTIVLYVKSSPCICDDKHIPGGACMATHSSIIGLFFQVTETGFWDPGWNFFWQFPTKIVQVTGALLICSVPYGLWHLPDWSFSYCPHTQLHQGWFWPTWTNVPKLHLWSWA